MLKKHLCVLIAIFAVLMAFSGCSSEEIPENSDLYENSPWHRNLFEHWQTDGRLEKINVGEHEFKNGVCSVCKTEIEDLGDSFVLTDYREDSKPRRETRYDPSGNMINEINYEYDVEGRLVNKLEHEYYYNKSGILTNSKLFQRGALLYEYEYATAANGSVYTKKQTCHDGENGSSLTEYDEHGNALIYNTYDKNGETITEITSEYSLNSSGNHYVSREVILNYGRNEKIIYEYDEHYQYTLVISEDFAGTYYYEDVYENEYDENGNLVYKRRFQNGQLMEETYFRDPSDTSYVIEKYITYGNDGTFAVFEYDIYGNETNVTDYYKDGSKGVAVAFGEYSFERIFTNPLNSSISSSGLKLEIKDSYVSLEDGGESKEFGIRDWIWEEFPFSEEEWNSMFIEGETFDLKEYGNVMYKSLNQTMFMLSADGELWFIRLFPNNITNGFYVWSIDKLIFAE
ncbi:MAG: hypothetical protein IKL18_02390 [Oscillospiraceae bacterium]|nr:hypothetical protein [Oscillospiraceae bacterium]